MEDLGCKLRLTEESKEENGEDEEEEGEDSDGVIVQASPSASRKSSGDGAGTSTIEITVVSFTAAKGAKFLKNKKVHSLYVSSDASTCQHCMQGGSQKIDFGGAGTKLNRNCAI